MYGNDSGMVNNNNDFNNGYNNDNYNNQDMNNNMTANNNSNVNDNNYNNNNNYNNYNNNNGYNNQPNYNPQPDYNNNPGYNGNVSFGGFDDNRTGAKKKLNKWVIIIPIIILILIILLIISFVSAANKYTVKTKNITVIIGESETIEVSASDKVKNKLTYKSADEKIATVDDNGNVTGVDVGTTNIWVGINGKKTVKVSVLVNTNKTELIFKENNITLEKDATYQLVINNVLADDKFEWKSSNENVATVDENGLVTGVHGGKAKITVTESDGRRSTADVTVTSDEVLIDSIVLVEQTIGIGETRQLKPIINPANGLQILTWESSKETVAVVDQTGKVTGLKEGTSTITVTTHNGKTAKAKITVDDKAVSSIKINGCVKSLKVGGSATLTTVISPTTAKQNVTWSSSNSNVLTVSGGRVTAKGKGSATITATAGGKTASCKIKVGSMAVTSLKMSTVQFSIDQGKTKTLSVTFNPSGAKDFYTVTWKSSNTKVATVDQNGVVTGRGPGTARIYAYAGGKSASAAVTVNRTSASSLSITNCPTSLTVNQKYTFRVSSNYSSAKITWDVSNTNYATITTGGVVTPKRVGTVTVYARTGSLEDSCTFEITDSLSLNGCPSGNVTAGTVVTLNASVESGSPVTWTSSNTGVATVSAGKVTTKAVGTVTITASSSGKTATCKINVVKPSITKINPITAITVNKGSSKTVTITTNLTAAQMTTFYTKSDLTFTYSTSGIATATATAANSFTVKGVKAGSTTIHVKIGGQSQTLQVTVK